MRPRTLPAAVLLAVALVGAASDIRAAQAPPMRLYGTVTIVGQPVAAGTVVQALVGSIICGTGTVGSRGAYQLDVYTSPLLLCSDGALMNFTVGGRPARETVVAQPGAFVPLDLTVPVLLPPPPIPPTATTEIVALFPGCNNVVTTWPGATPIGTVAGSVSPAGGLLAIWRYEAALGRFAGFAPQAVSVSDLVAVNRLDPVFICMTTPGTLARSIAAI